MRGVIEIWVTIPGKTWSVQGRNNQDPELAHQVMWRVKFGPAEAKLNLTVIIAGEIITVSTPRNEGGAFVRRRSVTNDSKLGSWAMTWY
jgi:hypothetical protein